MAIDVVTGELIESFWENFRSHPWQQLAHAATGALGITSAIAGGALIHPAFVGGLVISYLVSKRQMGEFQKRRDTIGHDMAWHIIGFCLGLVGSGTVVVVLRHV